MADYPFRYLGAMVPCGPRYLSRLVDGVAFLERRGVGLVGTGRPADTELGGGDDEDVTGAEDDEDTNE